MPEDILSQALRIRFEFKRRPVAITADFRPQWRVALLVLMLEKCWGRRATLGQLHVINWALRSRENLSNFLQQIEGHFRPGKALVRFEPSLNRAIDLAVGEKLVAGGAKDVLELTETGIRFAESLLKTEGLLEGEKQSLSQIKGKLTQRQVNSILMWE